jgi:hypothetical protein
MNSHPLMNKNNTKTLFDDTVASIIPESKSVVNYHRFSNDDTLCDVLGVQCSKLLHYLNNLVHTSVNVPITIHEFDSHDKCAFSSSTFPPLQSVKEY